MFSQRIECQICFGMKLDSHFLIFAVSFSFVQALFTALTFPAYFFLVQFVGSPVLS